MKTDINGRRCPLQKSALTSLTSGGRSGSRDRLESDCFVTLIVCCRIFLCSSLDLVTNTAEPHPRVSVSCELCNTYRKRGHITVATLPVVVGSNPTRDMDVCVFILFAGR
jgi:hypothetical protein